VTVRRLRRGEGEQLRELRLRALAEAPYAFATSFEAARERPAEHWEEFALKSEAAESQVTFVVFDGGVWLGMASAFLNPDERGEAQMVQMWVDPASRGLGLGRLLVEAVAQWARERGVTRLEASVTEGNKPAEVLYEGVGFLPTGEERPLASNPSLTEIVLTRDL
jgi:GNAT superfamily N-acetyltransferase